VGGGAAARLLTVSTFSSDSPARHRGGTYVPEPVVWLG
jgi:hypothetical protein